MPLALSMSAVVLAFAALMLGVLALRRRGHLDGEPCRKSVHIGMGLVTLAFPWLFHDLWPVLVPMILREQTESASNLQQHGRDLECWQLAAALGWDRGWD